MAEGRSQRKLAAILAADVVGYSRLIRKDEEGTLARVKSLLSELIDPKIAEHEGRIVKLMGDGMLVEFASVVDAVRAAVEVQQAMAERNASLSEENCIAFRVGINLGDVVIDGDDIQGDGVNVAARLEQIAKPGGICISGSVHEQVRDRIDLPFEDLGEQELKNIDRPVRVYRVHADSEVTAQSSVPERSAVPNWVLLVAVVFFLAGGILAYTLLNETVTDKTASGEKAGSKPSTAPETAELEIEGGVLMGARGVEVNGRLYNVRFVDGACKEVHGGICQPFFDTAADAKAASRALLDQVFVDGARGNFDTHPKLTNGITYDKGGWVCTLYMYDPTVRKKMSYICSINYSPPVIDRYNEVTAPANDAFSLGELDKRVWAVWANYP